ncbi:MAG: ABC transporter permease [Calditrichaeota bacterium]|nr:ABC transporter permease [Calditrichota bacterium]
MIIHQLHFLLKNIKRNLSYSLILIVCLILSSSTLTLIYAITVADMDNSLYKYPDRMIINDRSHRYKDRNNWGGILNYRLIKEIEKNDQIESSSTYSTVAHERWVNYENIKSNLFYCDNHLTDMFRIELQAGRFFSDEEYLNAQHLILLSEDIASQIFHDEQAIGKTIKVFQDDFTVIGVFKNIQQSNPHFKIDELLPLTTDENKDRDIAINSSSYNYKQLTLAKTKYDIPSIKKAMQEIASHFEVYPEGYQLQLYPYTLSEDIFGGRRRIDGLLLNRVNYQIFISSLLLFIIIASICFINMMNVKLAIFIKRCVEFGVRYSFGASTAQLIQQVSLEAAFFTAISLIFSLGITQCFFTVLNTISIYKYKVFSLNWETVVIQFAILLIISFSAHFIALFKLIRKKPVYLVKGIL